MRLLFLTTLAFVVLTMGAMAQNGPTPVNGASQATPAPQKPVDDDRHRVKPGPWNPDGADHQTHPYGTTTNVPSSMPHNSVPQF